MAVKHLISLQKCSDNHQSRRECVNQALDQANRDISEAKDTIVTHVTKLIKQREATMKDEVEEIRRVVSSHYDEVEDNLELLQERIRKVDVHARTLGSEAEQFPIRTVTEAPILKKKYLNRLQPEPVMSLECKIDREAMNITELQDISTVFGYTELRTKESQKTVKDASMWFGNHPQKRTLCGPSRWGPCVGLQL